MCEVWCCPQEPSAATLSSTVLPELNRRLDALQAQTTGRLQQQVLLMATSKRGNLIILQHRSSSDNCP